MMSFVRGTGLVVSLELRQRVRGLAWYVLLAVYFALVTAVTVLLFLTTQPQDWLFSLVTYFVLLLGTLITPALSGNAINGDRAAGTLATTQVTLLTTGMLVVGKFLAAWIATLAFLAVSLPFLVIGAIVGDLSAGTIVISMLVLAFELGVISAIGVGFSAIVTRQIFSVACTYLVVAALSVGTLIAFGLLVAASPSAVTTTTVYPSYDENGDVQGCRPPQIETYDMARPDRYWGVLAANPYVAIADATPPTFDEEGNAVNLFTMISFGVRAAQESPEDNAFRDYCHESREFSTVNQREQYDNGTAFWPLGLGILLLLAAGSLVWAGARTRTPAKRLPRGSRVA